MDTAINVNGDFDTDENGIAYRVSGIAEIKQKIYIILSARLGEFIYDRTLGSDIYSIDLSSENAADLVISKARNALAGIEHTEVTGVTIKNETVTVTVSICGESYNIELRI